MNIRPLHLNCPKINDTMAEHFYEMHCCKLNQFNNACMFMTSGMIKIATKNIYRTLLGIYIPLKMNF